MNGSSRNALVWYVFSLTISAVMVLMTPMLPLARPAMILQNRRAAKVLEKPKAKLERADTNKPNRIIDLRPCESESRPHGIEVVHCASGNAATRIPLSSEMREAWTSGGEMVDLMR